MLYIHRTQLGSAVTHLLWTRGYHIGTGTGLFYVALTARSHRYELRWLHEDQMMMTIVKAENRQVEVSPWPLRKNERNFQKL